MKTMIILIILLLSIHNYSILCLKKGKLIENILYGHSIVEISKLPIKTDKNSVINCVVEPTIKNFTAYLKNQTIMNTNTPNSGTCSYDINLKHFYNNENLANLESVLNENNYSFRDYYGNLIILSLCANEYYDYQQINKKCYEKLFYLSNSNFDFYQFRFTGEKFPQLSSFSFDSNSSPSEAIIIINGGIKKSGTYNSEFYQIQLKYNTGEAVVGRILNSNSDVKPIGLLDNSLSVINYSKNKYLAISIGGSDENSITNQIYSFDINKNVLKNIKSKSCEIAPRKGHSATVIKNLNKQTGNGTISDIIENYDIVIFGGKNEKGETLNNLIIIKITYVSLDDQFYYSSINSITPRGDIPEPREGHQALYHDNSIYIIGGCDFSKGKCYNNEIYKLELLNEKYTWTQIKKEHSKINNNIAPFMGGFTYYDNEKREFMGIISQLPCECNLELYYENKEFTLDCSGSSHKGYVGLVGSNEEKTKRNIYLPTKAKINLKCDNTVSTKKDIIIHQKEATKKNKTLSKKTNHNITKVEEEEEEEELEKSIKKLLEEDDEQETGGDEQQNFDNETEKKGEATVFGVKNQTLIQIKKNQNITKAHQIKGDTKKKPRKRIIPKQEKGYIKNTTESNTLNSNIEKIRPINNPTKTISITLKPQSKGFLINFIYCAVLFIGIVILISLFFLCNMNSLMNKN